MGSENVEVNITFDGSQNMHAVVNGKLMYVDSAGMVHTVYVDGDGNWVNGEISDPVPPNLMAGEADENSPTAAIAKGAIVNSMLAEAVLTSSRTVEEWAKSLTDMLDILNNVDARLMAIERRLARLETKLG